MMTLLCSGSHRNGFFWRKILLVWRHRIVMWRKLEPEAPIWGLLSASINRIRQTQDVAMHVGR